eukprot:scaffold20032_cov96-Isochrysis_galbana.AAC.2
MNIFTWACDGVEGLNMGGGLVTRGISRAHAQAGPGLAPDAQPSRPTPSSPYPHTRSDGAANLENVLGLNPVFGRLADKRRAALLRGVEHLRAGLDFGALERSAQVGQLAHLPRRAAAAAAARERWG